MLFMKKKVQIENQFNLSEEDRFCSSEKILFEDLSFSLPPGGIVGVIGPNGSGKTTFLKLLAGLIAPKTGIFSYNYKNLITKKEILIAM